jgi:L-alanine-DL-glutamate epimerase-like enolase superfamily enzyme
MKIEAIILREIRMRLKTPFETSFGVTQDRRIILVEVLADGISGWGEVTAGETPGYTISLPRRYLEKASLLPVNSPLSSRRSAATKWRRLE